MSNTPVTEDEMQDAAIEARTARTKPDPFAELDKPMPSIVLRPEHDPVNHPSHYTSSPACCSACGAPIECIQITRHHGFNIGNAIKYLWRARLKAGIEDLKKAVWYIQDEIKEWEREV